MSAVVNIVRHVLVVLLACCLVILSCTTCLLMRPSLQPSQGLYSLPFLLLLASPAFW